MVNSKVEIASAFKIAARKDRVKAYLEGEKIFPVTLELDLTSDCTRVCPECPSVNSARHRFLSRTFLDGLFGDLERQTPGLLLTGGEPTMAPLFPEVLAGARRSGFQEIAVVTNGSLLDRPAVRDALLEHATTIRISLYDWDNGAAGDFGDMLKRIERLRRRVDRDGSPLKIGTSALTSAARADHLESLVGRLRDVGVRWIYFHPLCSKWGLGSPILADQEGILPKLEGLTAAGNGGAEVYFFRERYEVSDLAFSGYHAAHFLLVVGADGLNYLAPEVKYQPKFAIADFQANRGAGRLWDAGRTGAIDAIESRTYEALKSRHRGILYSHFIDGLQRGEKGAVDHLEVGSKARFLFPYIL